MTSLLPDALFANPIWHALRSVHLPFRIGTGEACRYPAAVAPFVAIEAPTEAAMEQLLSLLSPGESVWLMGTDNPCPPGLDFVGSLPCLQMALPASIEPAAPNMDIVELSEANAGEMVALTDLAFPGFFRPRTCEMGAYYGIRSPSGELIVMGGERMKLDGFSEISAVCTHPSFRGQGLAESLIWRVVRKHRREGIASFLHVGSANQRAIALYRRLGFEICREVTIGRLIRF